MKIAFFYENLCDGVRASGRRTQDVLAELHDAGMELLYMTPDSWTMKVNGTTRIV